MLSVKVDDSEPLGFTSRSQPRLRWPLDQTMSADDDQTVFWPYRPRQGYPSAPGWLVLLVIAWTVVLFFVVPIVLAEILYHLGLLPIPAPS